MKTAFICSGGGCKGAWEAGVIAQLCAAGIRPDAVYGSSAGALNAAGYAYLGENGLKARWLSVEGKKDVLSPHGWQWLWRWPRLFYAAGIHTTEPLRKELESFIHGVPRCLAVACSVELSTGKLVYTDNSDPVAFAKAVRASSTIPLIMEPVDGQVDGGVREQTPLAKAMQDGYDRYYIILANPVTPEPMESWKAPRGMFKWYGVLKRSVDDIMCHEIFLNDITAQVAAARAAGKEVHVYAPAGLVIGTLEFDPIKLKAAFESGFVADEVILPVG